MTSLFVRILQNYVRAVNKINHVVGHFAIWLLMLMLAVLIWSVITKTLNSPAVWAMEMAQFTMAAYYLLGAGFSMQQNAHVRMDFLYERWSPRRRAITDTITSLFMMFYLLMLVIGGWGSSANAIETGQHNHTVWAPYLAPIKIIMTTGMFLMLLQSTAEFLKDIFRSFGKELLPESVAETNPVESNSGPISEPEAIPVVA